MKDGLEERLALAVAIAREAGALMLRHLADAGGLGTSLKGPQDYVTAADREVETLIRRRLAERFPQDSMLGEEAGGEVGDAAWVVDPVDGTANYAHRVGHFAVSIGFAAAGKPALGVIYDPTKELLFSAAAGGGAFLNGAPMRVSSTATVDHAFVELGCYRRSPPPANYARLVEAAIAAGAAFRWSGSAALALADVARGANDAFYGLHLQSWDALAGILLVTEAGGRVSDFLANDGIRRGNALLASNAALFKPLARLFPL